MSILDRIGTLLKERKEELPLLMEKARNRDPRGVSTASLMEDYRFIGIAECLVTGGAEPFRRGLAASAELQRALFERFESGGDVSLSYVAMTAGYNALLNALAAGDADLSLQLALRIGGREAIEHKNDHPFDRAFGYALKATVLQSSDCSERASAFAAEVAKAGNRDFQGYADALGMLATGKLDDPAPAFSKILEGHRKQSKGRGVFKDTEDEALCVWGVAIANLLIWRGARLDVDDPLIPRVLLAQPL